MARGLPVLDLPRGWRLSARHAQFNWKSADIFRLSLPLVKSYELKCLDRFVKVLPKWHLNVLLIDASPCFQVNGTLQV